MADSAAIKPQGESFRSPLLWIILATVAALFVATAWFGKSNPEDAEVLLILPARGHSDTNRESDWKKSLNENPRDSEAAAALARIYIERARSESEPRYLGYAQHVLIPWSGTPRLPVDIQRIRATLLQAQHRFGESLHELNALLQHNPDDTQSRLTRATVHQVIGNYQNALNDCLRLVQQAPVIGTACTASNLSLTGKAARAQELLQQIEPHLPKLRSETRQWILTIAAEVADHIEDPQRASRYFQMARNEPQRNAYLLRTYSDFLLRNDKPREALSLIKDETHDDSLLLHAAIAAKKTGDKQHSEKLAQLIEARLHDASLKGSDDHYYLAARYAFEFKNNAKKTLVLAQQNWRRSKELRDTELLATVAIALGDKTSIAEITNWMKQQRIVLPRVSSILSAK